MLTTYCIRTAGDPSKSSTPTHTSSREQETKKRSVFFLMCVPLCCSQYQFESVTLFRE
ncbi:hypothetical protein BHE74_00010617 [Ensete ventricosum]|nr:hypothetical protein GW17_00040974 [Ensete ventricosum]RWW81013.1 hypothetical protein BHE74_00010617 [Ensete ventricosum]